MSTGEYQRYRFGPLERRGLIGSLRPAQVIVIAVEPHAGGDSDACALERRRASSPRSPSRLLAAAFCFWPIGGRSAEEWLPIVARHAAATALGHATSSGHRRRRPEHGSRRTDARSRSPRFPRSARDLELLAAPFHGEHGRCDQGPPRAHRTPRCWRCSVTSFGLLDRAEQESRQAGWGGVLAGLAREGSPVSRIQWVERTVPADGDEIGRYLGEAWARDAVPLDSLADAVVPRADEQRPGRDDGSRALRLSCRSTPSAPGVRSSAWAARRDPTPARARVLLRELEALAERLAAADVRVVGALRPGMLATAIRVAFDPWSRPGLARLAAADPDRDGIDEAAAWPIGDGDVVERATARTAPFHATYWIASWPRIDVGAAFLSPLLLHAQMVRAIAVTIEPISPLKAIREVEAARTTDVADRELRGRMGFIETARRKRQTEAVARREEELADGHAAVRFAGYVTVSARTLDELERDCSEIEHAAQMARLELLRLYGQQEEAFTYTLPLCRGLR